MGVSGPFDPGLDDVPSENAGLDLRPGRLAIILAAFSPRREKGLVMAGCSDVERVELPFPARHYDRYVKELTDRCVTGAADTSFSRSTRESAGPDGGEQ